MASILSNNYSQPTQTASPPQDPMATINSLIDQVMRSGDPKATFSQVVNNIQGGQNALDLIQQYGNGDPKAAFMNYAAQQGRNALAQQIMSGMGLSK